MTQDFILLPYGELSEGGANNDYLVPDFGMFTETSLNFYSLSITTGVYVITGVATGLLAGHKIAPATGTYLISGKTAGLLWAHKLPVTTGAYIITGLNADLRFGHTLSATTGVYTVSGKAAGLLYGRVMDMPTGVYVITGHDAEFTTTIPYHASFAEFNNTDFLDWGSGDFSSYLVISQSDEQVDTKEQAPYVYTFLKQTADSDEDSEGATITGYWDWANDPTSKRVTQPQEIYQFRNGFLVCARRHKMRGRGRQLQLRYDSETGKNFNLLGWAVFYTHNAHQ